jgi:hypothetical protein
MILHPPRRLSLTAGGTWTMTWFSNSVAERALTLITQHVRDCEMSD